MKLMKCWILFIWSFEEIGMLSLSWLGLLIVVYFLVEFILCFVKLGIVVRSVFLGYLFVNSDNICFFRNGDFVFWYDVIIELK